jgi:hypothetical protein
MKHGLNTDVGRQSLNHKEHKEHKDKSGKEDVGNENE